ncbi:hypothetical protein TWF192_007039 [Orbilia oligospora]|nr:hypothetical protein TWF192_007039 [Orbilia oligospora]
MHSAFDAAAYDGGNLIWPHSYHLTPEEVLAYRFFRPGAAYSYLEPHGLDHIGYSELQVATPHVYYREPAKHKDILAERANINIPDFLPLPVELTHKVLCYLPGTDIIALSKMKSFKTLQVPDFVWKSQFDLGSELGFLVQPHFMIDAAETTWQAKYLFTKKIISENYRSAANLKRRWDIFTSLVHKLRDTDNCDEANIYDLDPEGPAREFGYNVDQDQALVCQSLPQKLHPGDTNRGLHCEGMYVSYTGAGKLRFVSGFRFLPGGEKLGLINPEDEEYVHLQMAMASTQVIWVATSKYGIRSVFIEGKETPLVIGTKTDFSTDAAIEKDEAIISLELLIGGKDSLPVGLSVRTDRGVAFHFIIPNLPQKPRKHTLDVGKDKEIVGIFAGFNGCPAVLGHLSSTATKNTFEIESDRGEYIVAVDVYIRKIKLAPNLEFSLAVVGIVFWTSSRRKISCGKCQAEYASKVLPLRTSIEEDFVLKWIYSRNIDYLTNIKEF